MGTTEVEVAVAEKIVEYRKEMVRGGLFEMPENIARNHITYRQTAQAVDRSLEVADEALRVTRDAPGRARPR